MSFTVTPQHIEDWYEDNLWWVDTLNLNYKLRLCRLFLIYQVYEQFKDKKLKIQSSKEREDLVSKLFELLKVDYREKKYLEVNRPLSKGSKDDFLQPFYMTWEEIIDVLVNSTNADLSVTLPVISPLPSTSLHSLEKKMKADKLNAELKRRLPAEEERRRLEEEERRRLAAEEVRRRLEEERNRIADEQAQNKRRNRIAQRKATAPLSPRRRKENNNMIDVMDEEGLKLPSAKQVVLPQAELPEAKVEAVAPPLPVPVPLPKPEEAAQAALPPPPPVVNPFQELLKAAAAVSLPPEDEEDKAEVKAKGEEVKAKGEEVKANVAPALDLKDKLRNNILFEIQNLTYFAKTKPTLDSIKGRYGDKAVDDIETRKKFRDVHVEQIEAFLTDTGKYGFYKFLPLLTLDDQKQILDTVRKLRIGLSEGKDENIKGDFFLDNMKFTEDNIETNEAKKGTGVGLSAQEIYDKMGGLGLTTIDNTAFLKSNKQELLKINYEVAFKEAEIKAAEIKAATENLKISSASFDLPENEDEAEDKAKVAPTKAPVQASAKAAVEAAPPQELDLKEAQKKAAEETKAAETHAINPDAINSLPVIGAQLPSPLPSNTVHMLPNVAHAAPELPSKSGVEAQYEREAKENAKKPVEDPGPGVKLANTDLSLQDILTIAIPVVKKLVDDHYTWEKSNACRKPLTVQKKDIEREIRLLDESIKKDKETIKSNRNAHYSGFDKIDDFKNHLEEKIKSNFDKRKELESELTKINEKIKKDRDDWVNLDTRKIDQYDELDYFLRRFTYEYEGYYEYIYKAFYYVLQKWGLIDYSKMRVISPDDTNYNFDFRNYIGQNLDEIQTTALDQIFSSTHTTNFFKVILFSIFLAFYNPDIGDNEDVSRIQGVLKAISKYLNEQFFKRKKLQVLLDVQKQEGEAFTGDRVEAILSNNVAIKESFLDQVKTELNSILQQTDGINEENKDMKLKYIATFYSHYLDRLEIYNKENKEEFRNYIKEGFGIDDDFLNKHPLYKISGECDNLEEVTEKFYEEMFNNYLNINIKYADYGLDRQFIPSNLVYYYDIIYNAQRLYYVGNDIYKLDNRDVKFSVLPKAPIFFVANRSSRTLDFQKHIWANCENYWAYLLPVQNATNYLSFFNDPEINFNELILYNNYASIPTVNIIDKKVQVKFINNPDVKTTKVRTEEGVEIVEVLDDSIINKPFRPQLPTKLPINPNYYNCVVSDILFETKFIPKNGYGVLNYYKLDNSDINTDEYEEFFSLYNKVDMPKLKKGVDLPVDNWPDIFFSSESNNDGEDADIDGGVNLGKYIVGYKLDEGGNLVKETDFKDKRLNLYAYLLILNKKEAGGMDERFFQTGPALEDVIAVDSIEYKIEKDSETGELQDNIYIKEKEGDDEFIIHKINVSDHTKLIKDLVDKSNDVKRKEIDKFVTAKTKPITIQKISSAIPALPISPIPGLPSAKSSGGIEVGINTVQRVKAETTGMKKASIGWGVGIAALAIMTVLAGFNIVNSEYVADLVGYKATNEVKTAANKALETQSAFNLNALYNITTSDGPAKMDYLVNLGTTMLAKSYENGTMTDKLGYTMTPQDTIQFKNTVEEIYLKPLQSKIDSAEQDVEKIETLLSDLDKQIVEAENVESSMHEDTKLAKNEVVLRTEDVTKLEKNKAANLTIKKDFELARNNAVEQKKFLKERKPTEMNPYKVQISNMDLLGKLYDYYEEFMNGTAGSSYIGGKSVDDLYREWITTAFGNKVLNNKTNIDFLGFKLTNININRTTFPIKDIEDAYNPIGLFIKNKFEEEKTKEKVAQTEIDKLSSKDTEFDRQIKEAQELKNVAENNVKTKEENEKKNNKKVTDLKAERTRLKEDQSEKKAIVTGLETEKANIEACVPKVLASTTPIMNCKDLKDDGVSGDETCVETSTFQDFVRQAEALLAANPDLLSTPKQFKIGTDGGGGRSRHNRKVVVKNVSTRSRRTIPTKVVDAVPKKVTARSRRTITAKVVDAIPRVSTRSRKNTAKVVVTSKKTTARSRKVQQILDSLPSPKVQRKSPSKKASAGGRKSPPDGRRKSPRGRSSRDGSSDLTFVNTSYTPFNTCKVFKAL